MRNGLLALLVLVLAVVIAWFALRESRQVDDIEPVRTEREKPEVLLEVTGRTDVAVELADAAPAALERDEVDTRVKTVSVHGSLRTRTGAPLPPGAGVGAISETGLVSTERFVDGQWHLEGLLPGDWWFRAVAPGFRSEFRHVTLRSDAPNDRVDLVLDVPTLVRVHVVTPDGSPYRHRPRMSELGGALHFIAVATKNAPGSHIACELASPHDPCGVGRFWNTKNYGPFEPDELGVVELEGELPVHVSLVLRSKVIATRQVDAAGIETRVDGRVGAGNDSRTASVTFTLADGELERSLGRVRLRVVDGASGDARSGFPVGVNAQGIPVPAARTDDDGAALLQGLVPGPANLVLGGPGDTIQTFPIHVEAGATRDLGTYYTVEPVSVRGKVVDLAGKPVADVALEWTEIDGDTPRPFLRHRIAATDSAGEFVIAGIAPGRYLVRTRTGGHGEHDYGGDPTPVDATRDVDDLSIRVARSVRVLIVPRDGHEGWTRIEILSKQKHPVHIDWLEGTNPTSFRVAPGRYYMVIDDQERTFFDAFGKSAKVEL